MSVLHMEDRLQRGRAEGDPPLGPAAATSSHADQLGAGVIAQELARLIGLLTLTALLVAALFMATTAVGEAIYFEPVPVVDPLSGHVH